MVSRYAPRSLILQLTLCRLGYVKPQDVPSILDKALEDHTLDWNPSAAPPLLPSHWRGRMGLEKEQQLALAAVHAS